MKFVATAARLAGVLCLAGCALFVRPDPQAAPKPAEPGQSVAAASVTVIDRTKIAPSVESPYWAKVRAGAPLKIGVNANYPPFTVRQRASKLKPDPFAGFDVDLARHLGETLGVPVALVGISSGQAADLLNDGSIDIAIAGLTRTVYRAAQVNFSAPYLTVSQAALVERRFAVGTGGTDEEQDRPTMESYADLASEAGIRIGVAEGTRPHRIALDWFPNARIVPFPTIEEASTALIAGKLNALVHDDPYVRVWSVFHPTEATRFTALLEPVTEEPIAMAIRKGDLDFLRFLDAYVAEVREDGTVAALYRRHFVDAAWAPNADLGGAK